MSYKIDYHVNSSSVGGSKSRGSCFIRGIKSESGYDSFSFCLEKLVDFAELDSQLILNGIEFLLKMQQPEPVEEEEKPAARF